MITEAWRKATESGGLNVKGSRLSAGRETRSIPSVESVCSPDRNRARFESPLQHVDWLGEVRHADVFGERWVLLFDGLEHLPRYAAIAEVAGRA
jgi:hypothetical protein